MINKWKLFNFKSIRNETEIELKPLTILAGANSSGKSTVLQSMLLISQTLYSRVSSRSVILNGSLTRLGQFDDIKSFGSDANQILVGWESTHTYKDFAFANTVSTDTVSCEISFETASAHGESNISQLQPRLFSCQISINENGNQALFSTSRLPSHEVRSLDRELKIAYQPDESPQDLDFHVELDKNSLEEFLYHQGGIKIVGCRFQHFLPNEIVLLSNNEETMKHNAGYDNFLIRAKLDDPIKKAVNYIDNLFISDLKYLGPLRDEPKSLYPLTPSADPNDVGLRGEYTAAVLDLHKNDQIQYIPTASFETAQVSTTKKLRSLENAVSDWLVYLGVAQSVNTIDRGKIGHEMKVILEGSKMAHDLTHVGVGVSQVLPILVTCLLAEPGAVILIEQPELHLHPKVQTRLADFFLSMSMLDKQCIIETHSEYIVNRLRFRSAAASVDSISALLKIYFVNKIDGCSEFNSIEVNKYGAITDWPDGFFDQSQSEAEEILRAATMKLKMEKGYK